MQQRLLTLVTVGALAVATTHCTPAGTASNSTPPPSATAQTVAAQQPDTPDPETATADSNTPQTVAEAGSNACITWSEAQADLALTFDEAPLPQMPAGFESGCVFKVGQGLSSPVYILSDGIGLNQITAVGVTTAAYSDGAIPWFQGREVDPDALTTLTDNGNIVTYYQACVTAGGYASNCEGFPDNEPYVLSDNTACLQGNCLQVAGVPATHLVTLWPNLPDPTAQSTPGGQTAIRNQYRTVPLETLFSELPVIGPDAEAIALSTFGRTDLGEGEQPTVVTNEGYQGDYLVINLTNEGLADDSVGGYRYRLEFESFDNDQVKLVWVGQQNYCWRSLPPQWTADLCP